MRERIKAKIKTMGNVGEFADKHGIRRATLYDYLNGKHSVGSDILSKIIEGAKMSIGEELPERFVQFETVTIDGIRYEKNDVGGDVKVHLCFGSTSTEHKGVLLEDLKNNELMLIVR